MPSSSLAEKVRAILATDTPTGFTGPWDACDSEPGGPRDLSDFECDMRHWGLTYGLAYGIARGEDPYEPNHQVAERALGAAKLAWEGWAHKLDKFDVAHTGTADPRRASGMSARAGRGLTRLHRCPDCGAGPGDPCDGGDDHRLRVATAEREAQADLQADLAEGGEGASLASVTD